MRAISGEVVGPGVIGVLRPQTDARVVVEPETAAFGLLYRDFEPLSPPGPFDALFAHQPSGHPQHRGDPAIAITRLRRLRATVAPAATTKSTKVVAMLSSTEGATIDAMMKATGWQQHSVRGFLADNVKKKLGLTLTSERHDDERIYRLATA